MTGHRPLCRIKRAADVGRFLRDGRLRQGTKRMICAPVLTVADRIDAVAGAVADFQRAMMMDVDQAAKAMRDEEMEQEIKDSSKASTSPRIAACGSMGSGSLPGRVLPGSRAGTGAGRALSARRSSRRRWYALTGWPDS
jgi:hypothetical protein